jgi:precorrin-4/cobalt-precorrin-4 C11-methyltransferase
VAETGPVYFVSCGPGSPDFLTVAGLRAIERSRAVLAPAHYAEVFRDILTGKEVTSPFLMKHDEVASWVETRLSRGPVAFLVPGDFSTFCPFQSFVSRFRPHSRVIPGVSAHVAAAALVGKTFDMPGVAHCTVVTSPKAYARDGGRIGLRELGGEGRTLVLYMNDLPLQDLTAELKAAYPGDTPIAIFERIGGSDERVTIATLDTVVDVLGDRDPYEIGSRSPEPSLALTVVGRTLTADESPSWWDHRYEKTWKPRGMR